MLVTPLLDDIEEFEPGPELLLFDMDGNFVDSYAQPDPLQYLSPPFMTGINGTTILFGVQVLNDDLSHFTTLPPQGLTGFGFFDTAKLRNHILSQPSGTLVTHTLEYGSYNAGWNPEDLEDTVDIVPKSEQEDPPANPNAPQPGFRPVGVRDTGDGNITVLLTDNLSDRLTGTVVEVWRLVWDPPPPPPPPADPPRPEGWSIVGDGTQVLDIDARNSFVYMTDDDLILRRNEGWFHRYGYDGSDRGRVVAERGTGRGFAFDPDGERLFRFDPEGGTLAVFDTWW